MTLETAARLHATAWLIRHPDRPCTDPRVTTEPVPAPTTATPAPKAPAQLAKTGATLDGIKIALAALALGVFLAACVYVSNRRGMGGEGR